MAFTLQTGRDPMAARLAIIAADKADLLEALDLYIKDETANRTHSIFVGSAKTGDRARPQINPASPWR